MTVETLKHVTAVIQLASAVSIIGMCIYAVVRAKVWEWQDKRRHARILDKIWND